MISYAVAVGLIGGCGKKAADPAAPAVDASASPSASPSPTIDTLIVGTWVSGCSENSGHGEIKTYVFGADLSFSFTTDTYAGSVTCASGFSAGTPMAGTYAISTAASGVTGATSIDINMPNPGPGAVSGIAAITGSTLFVSIQPGTTRPTAFKSENETLKQGAAATTGYTNIDNLVGTWMSDCSTVAFAGSYYRFKYIFTKTGTLTGTVDFTSSNYGASATCAGTPTVTNSTGTLALDAGGATYAGVGKRSIAYTWTTGASDAPGSAHPSPGYSMIQFVTPDTFVAATAAIGASYAANLGMENAPYLKQ